MGFGRKDENYWTGQQDSSVNMGLPRSVTDPKGYAKWQGSQGRIAPTPAPAPVDPNAPKKNLLGQDILDYEGTTEESGALKSPFSMMQQGPGEFEGMLQQRARQEGLSPEAQLAIQQQTGDAAQQQLGLQAGQEEQLAMRGGLGGGARERLAQAGQQQLALQQQGIRGNIGAKDMSNKLGLQTQLAGYGLKKGESDIQAARADQASRQKFGLDQFLEESKAIAATKSAEEQRKAASSVDNSGLLGLGFMGL